jgi:hypothetical protein
MDAVTSTDWLELAKIAGPVLLGSAGIVATYLTASRARLHAERLLKESANQHQLEEQTKREHDDLRKAYHEVGKYIIASNHFMSDLFKRLAGVESNSIAGFPAVSIEQTQDVNALVEIYGTARLASLYYLWHDAVAFTLSRSKTDPTCTSKHDPFGRTSISIALMSQMRADLKGAGNGGHEGFKDFMKRWREHHIGRRNIESCDCDAYASHRSAVGDPGPDESTNAPSAEDLAST